MKDINLYKQLIMWLASQLPLHFKPSDAMSLLATRMGMPYPPNSSNAMKAMYSALDLLVKEGILVRIRRGTYMVNANRTSPTYPKLP